MMTTMSFCQITAKPQLNSFADQVPVLEAVHLVRLI